jgi:hypothetical protein
MTAEGAIATVAQKLVAVQFFILAPYVGWRGEDCC